MKPEATPEHLWLMQLVGEWTIESECVMGPGGEKNKTTGREVVRALGDLWVVGEMTADIPDGTQMICLLTIGYDPARGKYVGSWVGSVMTHMFTYEGERDATGNTLTLSCTGPSFEDPAKTANYQDIIEMRGPDERGFYSQIQNADGTWFRFQEGLFRRVK